MKEIILGNRIMSFNCEEEKSCEVQEKFLNFILTYQKEVLEIMDNYEIPQEIIINFKEGDGKLEGQYYVNRKEVREHLVVIDIYTKHLHTKKTFNNLIDTFIHEMVHNKVKEDKKTKALTKKLIKKIFNK